MTDILDDLRAALLAYVIFPSTAAVDAVTLWIAATHCQPAWNAATRLVIKAPEKRCGKSRLLDIVEATCHSPLITVNISPAALVRSITSTPPTLLLDEADAVFGKKAADNHEDLRGLLNAGHQRNRPYIRWDAVAKSAEHCPTFAMAALAGIGDMPETIEDRAVIIAMRRRAPGETVKPYRVRRDGPALSQLRARLAEWASTVVDKLADAAPDMPVEDRAADNWEPLVAVADAVGGTWPVRARSAAAVLVAAGEAADTDRSQNLRLLSDIRDVTVGETFVSSADLADRLHGLEESPWRDFGITSRQLAAKLKKYGVHSGHDNTKTKRGYKISAFADAWARYLPESVGGQRPEPSERPDGPEMLQEPPDAYESPDGSMRPDDTQASGDFLEEHRAADVRTLTDATPDPASESSDLEASEDTFGRGTQNVRTPAVDDHEGVQDLHTLQGNPICQVCGTRELYHPRSIERGVCAACVKVTPLNELAEDVARQRRAAG